MPKSNASLVSKQTSVTLIVVINSIETNFDFLVENMPNICCLRTQTRFFFVSSSFNFVWFIFAFPELTFSEVEEYAQKESGRRHTTKGYKFLLSLDIYTMWKTSFLIVRKSIPNAEMGFENDVSIYLQQDKLTSLDVLGLFRQTTIEVEEKTRAQSQSSLWMMLRNKRITASKFGQVAKR